MHGVEICVVVPEAILRFIIKHIRVAKTRQMTRQYDILLGVGAAGGTERNTKLGFKLIGQHYRLIHSVIKISAIYQTMALTYLRSDASNDKL